MPERSKSEMPSTLIRRPSGYCYVLAETYMARQWRGINHMNRRLQQRFGCAMIEDAIGPSMQAMIFSVWRYVPRIFTV